MKKFHRNLFLALEEVLTAIFLDGRYADKALESLFKRNKKWGKRDRAFIAVNTYEIIRWKRKVLACGSINLEEDKEAIWALIGTHFVLSNQELPMWEEFSDINGKKIWDKANQFKANRSVMQSIPQWLDKLMVEELGEELWDKEIKALNIHASVILRVNTLKSNLQEVKAKLEEIEIETEVIHGYPHALKLTRKKNVFTNDLFKNGYFEVQDASSQLIAPFAQLSPGMKVIDTCAGAGGKTLHMAALMANKGRLVGTDIFEWKLNELKKRAKRNGAFNIENKVIDNTFIKRQKGTFDRVVIDAPCSGLGVIKRKPDTKWKLDLEMINRIKEVQTEILSSHSRMVKVGGKLVYATCSVLPSENRGQVDKFLKNNPNFELEEDHNIYSHKSSFDGFYMARMVRKS